MFITYSWTLSNKPFAGNAVFTAGREEVGICFFPLVGRKKKASQKYPRPAATAASLRGTEPLVSFSSFAFKRPHICFFTCLFILYLKAPLTVPS